MDVELLRPGTVPISPDTILWFEFLLDPNLLKRHLTKQSPDPSPTDLINEFSLVAPVQDQTKPVDLENPNSPTLPMPGEKYTKKQLALKILSLRIVAHLKWNLDILENNLPPQTQAQLVHDLLYMATDCTYIMPTQELPEDVSSQEHVKFALIWLYRWYLRFAVNAALLAKPNKTPFVQMPGMLVDTGYSQLNPHFEKLIQRAEAIRADAIKYLSDLVENEFGDAVTNREPFLIRVPVMETFKHLSEEKSEIKHDWTTGDIFMSQQELFLQINYDLTTNYFFHGQYELARKHILLCKKNMDNLEKEFEYFNTKSWTNFNYASVKKNEVFGYIKALDLAKELLNEDHSLLYQLEESIANKYDNLDAILQADNIQRVIPYIYRQNVELDIQGASSLGGFTISRDFQNRISALNVVRSVLEGELPSTIPDFINKLKNVGLKFVEMIFWAFAPVLEPNDLSVVDYKHISDFFLHLTISQTLFDVEKMEGLFRKYLGHAYNNIKLRLFKEEQLEKVRKYKNNDSNIQDYPKELLSNNWLLNDFDLKDDLKMEYLKQRLIDASSAEELRMCLVDFTITNPSLPPWKVNQQWQLPIPLQSIVLSLPRGFFQDFSYIILGKARHYAEIGDFRAALDLLMTLGVSREIRSGGTNMPKLCTLLGWEVLLVELGQLLFEWPQHNDALPSLVEKCRAVLGQHEGLAPRLQVVEWSLLGLLNAGKYEAIPTEASGAHLAGGSLVAELCVKAAADLARQQQKKSSREYWDLVLSAFTNNPSSQSKRSNTASSSYSNRDNLAQNKIKEALHSFIQKLREPYLITLTCSLLARIFNILKDDSNLELNIEYINTWPSTINNTNNYNLNLVSEYLNLLLEQSMKYHPNNIVFFKLFGDLNLANSNYTNALKYYLLSLCLKSDYFVQPLSKNLIDDQNIYRKMIKCCSQLNCPTQAAILCQFLDEIDYTLAFKCLSEKCNLNFDAMDSYYGCIWDTTILEFLVNLHEKRGETAKKQLAIKVMGLLELNSNNNDEIQREAANSRKGKFMRALVQQYV